MNSPLPFALGLLPTLFLHQTKTDGERRCAALGLKQRFAIALTLFSIMRISAASQELDPHSVQPERPTVATHAGTVAPGWAELEFGGELDRYADHTNGGSVPIVAKIGAASHVQLSIFESAVDPAGRGGIGPGDVAVGVKWRMTDDGPLLGRFAILPIVKFPTGSTADGLGTGTTDATLVMISSSEIEPVSLDVNASYTRRSGNGALAPTSAAFWTVSAGGSFARNFGWVGEVYGYPGTSGPSGRHATVALLFGPTFAPRRYFSLDGGFIVPLTGPQPRAVYIGGVWNVGRLW